jgi:hypothetical protein
MNHWETAGRMAAEHRADLDREAVRTGMAALVKAARPASRKPLHPLVVAWLHGLRSRRGSTGRAGSVDGPIAAR